MTTPIATPGTQGAGAAAPGDGQGAGGQPTGAGQGQGGFNWGLFPNVPEEQRPLLEPHLRGALGHVTQIEQQWAPYKFIQDAQVKPEQLQGILSFSEAFDKDPVGTWYSMAQQLAQSGALPEDLDVEDLGRILQGLPPAEEGQPGAQEAGQVDPNIAALTQQIQQLSQQVQGVVSHIQTEQQTREQQAQDQLLQRSLDGMKEQLKAAGFPVDKEGNLPVSDEDLTAHLITARGDMAGAVQRITGLRDGILKGFAGNGTTNPGSSELNMPNGAPPAPNKKDGANSTDPYAGARAGAQQFLRQNQAAAAQE